MRFCLSLFLAAFGIFISWSLPAQSTRPSISKEPAWVLKNTVDYSERSLDKHATDGYIDISYEKQVSLAEQSEYFRWSRKIISQAGVQNGSEISVPFDPSYSQLIFHSIYINRGGKILNRLQLKDIKTIQQEEELNNFIYNGSLNAILILDDVRMGDIIEYSYTRKGFNPIFKNRYSDIYDMEFAVPIYQIYYRLVVPPGRKINIKNINQTFQPAISSYNGQQVYEWRKKNNLPLFLQDYSPSWHDPYAQILVSEYNSWKEVNDWALELFPVKRELSAALQKKIREIKAANASDEERIKAALRFVQDDIRYMGIEMGENSHRPADPSKVFNQRFGDCKEKSYLMCCMLWAMNIDASPVLINTVRKKNLKTLLPAPTNFDHATVRVKLDNEYYWFDPTIAYQRGSIKKLFYPDYQEGLVISDSTSSLTNIDFRNVDHEYVKEYFKVPSTTGGATLVVTTTFQGNVADIARSDFNNQSITELMRSYQKFYSSYFEDIKADSLSYADDDETGIFTTTEYYTIPNFWTVDKENVSRTYISAFVINKIFRRPKEKDRKMPFAISYPANYKEEIIVDMPVDWKVTENETHLQNASFTFNSKFYCVDNQVRLESDYKNLKDHADIDEVEDYFKDLGEYDGIWTFELTYGGKEEVSASRSKTTNKNILSIILVVGIITGGFIWWSQRK